MQQMTGFPLIDVHQHVIPDFYRSALARVGILGAAARTRGRNGAWHARSS